MALIHLVELAIICLAALSLMFILAPGLHSKKIATLFLICTAVLIVLHTIGFSFRWQIVPAYFVVAALLIATLRDVQTGVFVKVAGSVLAGLLLLVSLTLLTGFPVPPLPEPTGPHKVGTITLNEEYSPENNNGSTEITRQLQLTLWYPALLSDTAQYPRETLWNELHDSDAFSVTERFFATYLKNIETSSYRGAPLNATAPARPVVIYNHALLSMASDNTLMTETLASFGYIVVGVRHKKQREEYFQLQEALSDEQKTYEKESALKLGAHMDRATRAELSLEVYGNNTTLAEIVRRRSRDSSHVLSNLESVLGSIPGYVSSKCKNTEKVVLVGFSLGGAVATELCKTDQRCSAAVNLDGGIFGSDITAPVTIPYLMVYSPSHSGGNDFLKAVSGDVYFEQTIEGAMHTDFHDATFVLPGLRWMGLLGNIGGEEMIKQRNHHVLTFLARTFPNL